MCKKTWWNLCCLGPGVLAALSILIVMPLEMLIRFAILTLPIVCPKEPNPYDLPVTASILGVAFAVALVTMALILASVMASLASAPVPAKKQ